MNLPNRLTIARVAVIPIFVVLMRLDTFWGYFLSLIIFIGAVLTDYYDGKIARKRNSVTDFGRLFDPVADKVLIAAAFISFLDKDCLGIPSWIVIVIIGRELLVTGLRSIAARGGVVIGAKRWGKLKAVSQMVCAITILVLITGREAMFEFLESVNSDFMSLYNRGMQLAAIVLMSLTMFFTVVSALVMFREHRGFLVSHGA